MARNEVSFRLLSFSTGLSPAHLCRVASGERRASTASALLIAKALGVAPEESCGPGRSERPSRLCTEVDNPVTADASPGDVADTPQPIATMSKTNDRGLEFTVERFMRSAKSSGLMPDCGLRRHCCRFPSRPIPDGYIEGLVSRLRKAGCNEGAVARWVATVKRKLHRRAITRGRSMRLGGWRSREMLDRYGASAAVGRALASHRRFSFGDRL